MIFFGWGGRSMTRELDPGHVLVLAYGYFHLFWLFRISWPTGYALATATEAGWATRPLSADEAASLDASSQLSLHWWWRWGLLVVLVGLAVMIMTSMLLP